MLASLLLLPMAESIIEVSPSGPLSLAEAVAKAEGRPETVIRLKGGLYRLTQPIRLGAGHKGLRIEASPGQKPILTGGVEVTGWKQEGHLWMAPAPAAVLEKGSRLFTINGQFRHRSRWPEEGALTHLTSFNVRWMSTTGGGWERKPTDEELTTLKVKADDLGSWFDPRSAEVTVLHMWDESCVGIKEWKSEEGLLTFSSPLGHPGGAFGVQKYVVWNTAKGLSRPGTWFLDRTNSQIVYRPKPGERPELAQAEVGLLESLFILEGVEGASFKGLTLHGCSTPLESGGFGALNYPGVIQASASPGLRLEGLHITGSSGYGIRAVNCPDGAVVKTEVKEVGAGGIRLEGDRTKVEDCVVERIGLQYPSGVGIFTAGAIARISHNTISETSYSAIIGAGAGSVIEANRIDRPMLALSDGAAIYVGFNENITLRGNLATRITDNEGYGSSAYYLDEQSKNCLVEGNVALGASMPSQNHMAQSGVIRGNLFISEGEMRLGFARCKGFRLEGNVLISRGGIVLRSPVDGLASLAGNSWDPGQGSVQMKVLEDYAEKATAAIPGVSQAKPTFSKPRPDLFEIKLPNQAKPLVWDMRDVGARTR